MRPIDGDKLKEAVKYSESMYIGYLNHCAEAGHDPSDKDLIEATIKWHEGMWKLIDASPTIEIQRDHSADIRKKGDMISRKAVYDVYECVNFASERERKYAYSLLKQIPTTQSEVPDINVGDINKFIDGLVEIFADIRESHVDDSVCGLCEFDGAYIGESGDWCNECPGFNRDDCFKLRDGIRKKWIAEITACMPTARSNACENTCEIERKSNDMISRQDAVSREAVSEWLKQYGQDVLHGKYKFSLMYIWKNLMDLPSVQPEKFEWCHDCKEYDQTQHYCPRWTKVIRQTVEELKAQPKIGKWIEHNPHKFGLGIVFECSECGEKIDCEEYNYCPNCGADMRGEDDG